MGEQKPWYHKGLKFSCSECGNCCTGFSGFVWVNKEEMEGLAQILELDFEEFQRLYTRKIGIRYSLKEFPNGSCVFFDEDTRKCQVYAGRPRQCRTWPFWESNLRTEQEWNRTCEVCPGSGTGRLYQLAEIENRRSAFRI